MEPASSQASPVQPNPGNAARVARHHPRNAVLAITLPADAEIRSARASTRTGPTEIGIGRQLPVQYRGNLASQLTWVQQPDGSYVAVLEIVSPGAKGMRAGIRALVPDGVVFRFFDPHDWGAVLPAYHPKSEASRLNDAEVHWSPTVSGDRLGVEVRAPHWDATAGIQFEIHRLSHLVVEKSRASVPLLGASPSTTGASCTSVPAACGRSSSCTQTATAKLSFVRPDGHAYVCTGTVINDDRELAEKQNRALMHTAFHCIDSQGAARSLEAEFHYTYEACDGSQLDSRYGRYYGGADLLEALPEHDQSLIRLRSRLNIAGVCFSGWSANERPTSTAVLSLHHPAGRPREAAAGQIRGYDSASFKDLGVVQVAVVEYSDGHTEGGSSGSGFFFGQRQRHTLSPWFARRRARRRLHHRPVRLPR